LLKEAHLNLLRVDVSGSLRKLCLPATIHEGFVTTAQIKVVNRDFDHFGKLRF
jgi:hypothetical protein